MALPPPISGITQGITTAWDIMAAMMDVLLRERLYCTEMALTSLSLILVICFVLTSLCFCQHDGTRYVIDPLHYLCDNQFNNDSLRARVQ